jgi:hypothetical protein
VKNARRSFIDPPGNCCLPGDSRNQREKLEPGENPYVEIDYRNRIGIIAVARDL